MGLEDDPACLGADRRSIFRGCTIRPEINIAIQLPLENQWLEDVCPFGMAYFQRCFGLFQGVYSLLNSISLIMGI